MKKFTAVFAFALSLLSLPIVATEAPNLVGQWHATRFGRVEKLAQLGRAYKAVVIAKADNNTIELIVSGCNTENFIYRIDGSRLTYSCGRDGICTNGAMSCAFPRIAADGSIVNDDVPCSDALPYCRKRLSEDEDSLYGLLREASSLQLFDGELVIFSASQQTEVHFKRDADA